MAYSMCRSGSWESSDCYRRLGSRHLHTVIVWSILVASYRESLHTKADALPEPTKSSPVMHRGQTNMPMESFDAHLPTKSQRYCQLRFPSSIQSTGSLCIVDLRPTAVA